MFGKRREWKHARREEFAYLRELVAVGCLLALIMGVLGFLSETDEKPPLIVTHDPAAEAPLPSRPVAAPISKDVRVPHSASRSEVEVPVVSEPAFDGIDPLATPEVFDRFDQPDQLDKPDEPEPFDDSDALSALGGVVAHVPSAPDASAQRHEPAKTPAPRTHVVVDKAAHTLTLFRGGEVVRQYDVAVGKNPGDKARAGDNRTPEGSFPVQQIHNAAHWVHDFGDGKGVIEGAYGPLFIRLFTPPWKGIGIHGTHDPMSIGTNATEGCVRMYNDDLLEFAETLEIGTTVTIR